MTPRAPATEVLLNHSQLTLAQQMRAEKLRQRLVESKLSKYNPGPISLPAEAKDKKSSRAGSGRRRCLN